MQVIFLNSIGTGIRQNLAGASDTLVVQGVTVASLDSTAVNGAGSNHNLVVAGTVSGSLGVTFGTSSSDTSNSVTVAATGSIYASSFGVTLDGQSCSLINHGIISSSFGTAVLLSGLDAGGIASRVLNYGTIEGGSNGIFHDASTQTLYLTNAGLIEGRNYSYTTFGAINQVEIDHIRNRGEMIGDISLGAGNDYYDGRGGLVEGTISGGADNDTFVTGLSEEVIDGGSGIDTLDFSKQTRIAVSLIGSFANTGTAAGDTYTDIENIIGSHFGNDTLTGDGADNALNGQGGVDVLDGGDGNDQLTGGRGADKLTGGLGNDVFIYNALTEAGDTIRDFHAALNDNDVLWINAASFGGGLTTGLLKAGELISEVGHVAQSATDRFIFDTAATSLWFDVDGTGAKAAILVADMQASATFSTLDILLI